MSDLLGALGRLDERLGAALTAARELIAVDAALLPYRGLFVGDREVERLLARDPGSSCLWSADVEPPELERDTAVAWLAHAFGLEAFDLDVVLLALAPEVDPRYERIYAFLQEDVTRRRPTVGLALDLLCPTPADRLAGRARLGASAPLLREQLLRLEGDAAAPRLSDTLLLDAQVVGLLLDEPGLDSRLTAFCELVPPAVATEGDLPDGALVRLVQDAVDERRALSLCFTGPPSTAKQRGAEALAGRVGMPLLAADLPHAGADTMSLLVREALLHDALLFVCRCDEARDETRAALLAALSRTDRVAILAAVDPLVPQPLDGAHGLVPVRFPLPGAPARRDAWRSGLATAGLEPADGDLSALAQRFRLTLDQIDDATAGVAARAALRGARTPELCDAYAAARAQTGHALAALATQVNGRARWQDIVVPEDVETQLQELCARVTTAETVMADWGFGDKLTRGKGVCALFAGAPGTGKTLAAEVVAGELGLDLFRIDLAGVVSKYIGETEKNLDRIFAAAEGANAVLLFDEADALFGKRSEVRDSHDRYANLEISYLLQKMESFEGIAILATNLRQNLDEAFARRLAFTVHFPFPEESARRRIWGAAWSDDTPLAPDLDLDVLAGLVLSGGNIRNAALASAFLAASEHTSVGMDHAARALRREYAKLGKGVSGDSMRELLGEPAAT